MNRKHILHLLQVNFQKWRENKPNDRNNMKLCVEMMVFREMEWWNHLHCENINEWMCQIPAGKFLALKFVD